jgi:hypothetical protein
MTPTTGKNRTTPVDSARTAPVVGYAAALASTVFGTLYLLGMIINLLTSGSTHSSSTQVQFISAVVAVLWDQTLVILFAAVRWSTEKSRKILGDLALAFMVLVSAASSVNWFTRLTVYPQAARAGDTALMALLDPYSERSIMFAFEHLGWGVFYALAVLFAAAALEGGGLARWLRWLFALSGILSLLHTVGLIVSNPVLSFLGYPAWGILLTAASALLAARFRRWPRA